MEGGEVGVAFGEGEGAEGEADGDVVQGVGGGCWGEGSGWDGNFGGGHVLCYLVDVILLLSGEDVLL